MGVFAELHIQNPVLLIFNGLMLAYRLGNTGHVNDGAEVVAPLTAEFGANLAAGFDHRERLQTLPLWLLDEPVDVVADYGATRRWNRGQRQVPISSVKCAAEKTKGTPKRGCHGGCHGMIGSSSAPSAYSSRAPATCEQNGDSESPSVAGSKRKALHDPEGAQVREIDSRDRTSGDAGNWRSAVEDA